MSILIKGIDLPEKDKAWSMDIYGNGEVVLFYAHHIEGREKIKAIQINRPHGRLIDIEKLKEEFAMKNNICKECDSFKKCDNKTYSKSEICENFIWVPTILEAEE